MPANHPTVKNKKTSENLQEFIETNHEKPQQSALRRRSRHSERFFAVANDSFATAITKTEKCEHEERAPETSESLGIQRMSTKKTGENRDLGSLLREPRRKARYPSFGTKWKGGEGNIKRKSKSNCKSENWKTLDVRSVFREPPKRSVPVTGGERTKTERPGHEGLGTDHQTAGHRCRGTDRVAWTNYCFPARQCAINTLREHATAGAVGKFY